MDDVTNPEAEVTEAAPAVEEDFEAFETKVDTEHEAEDGDEAEPAQEGDGNLEGEPDHAADDSSDDTEIEYDGEKYRVPKKLKDAFLRQSDYTQKTQAIAETRKELEATLERVQTASREETNALAQVAVIDSQLAQYDNIDWAAWHAQNPNDALAHRMQFMELKDARAAAVDGYTKAQNEARSIAQRETARRLDEGRKVLAEKIPEWGPDKARALRDFAINDYGFAPEVIDSIDDPLALIVLHDAMEGRKIRQQAEKKAKLEKQQAVKPVPTLKGNSGRPAFNPATTDFAAFERHAAKAAR